MEITKYSEDLARQIKKSQIEKKDLTYIAYQVAEAMCPVTERRRQRRPEVYDIENECVSMLQSDWN